MQYMMKYKKVCSASVKINECKMEGVSYNQIGRKQHQTLQSEMDIQTLVIIASI